MQKISELTNAYLHDLEIYEYTYPKMSSANFTYHKYPDKDKKGKYLDDGKCEVCGKRGTYTLIDDKKPRLCYKCYMACRAYRNLKIDVLKLQKKKTLTVAQAQKIVKYMNSYSKKKAQILTAVGLLLLSPEFIGNKK